MGGLRLFRSAVAVLIAAALLVPAAFVAPTANAHPRTLSTSFTPAALSQAGEQGILIQFAAQPGSAETNRLAALGFHSFRVFDSLPMVYAMGPTAHILDVANWADVTHVEPNLRLQYDLTSATIATHARNVWDSVREFDNPVRDANGHVVDGTGVGLAIIDTGADATHPDLPWHTKVVKNLKVLDSSSLVVDEPDTDTTSGHGTHVASIAGGTGAAGEGRFAGAAPGASIYMFGVGEAISVLFAFSAFDWIDKFGETQTPPIHVVSNSWGATCASSCAAYDPNDAINKIVNRLVTQKDMVVLFAAGNDGGDGSADKVNAYAKNPTPGVLGVANYNDEGTTTRDGVLDASSSRGLATNASTWPDLSAPGTNIQAAQPLTGFTMNTYGGADFGLGGSAVIRREPYYYTLTGTSMATPHAAGIAALLFQANPAITPADVEHVLKQTAHKFSFGASYKPDPSDPGFTSSDDKGAGLIDALAAVQDARVLGTAAHDTVFPQTTSEPHHYLYNLGGIAPDPFTPLPTPYLALHGQTTYVGAQSITSGDRANWPLSDTETARMVALGPNGEVLVDATPDWYADSTTSMRMDANFVFPTAGIWRIEPQVDFPGVGLRGVDSWTVTVE
ncbi:MAG: S8 family peptidase [Thermoplasmatota archaeon]